MPPPKHAPTLTYRVYPSDRKINFFGEIDPHQSILVSSVDQLIDILVDPGNQGKEIYYFAGFDMVERKDFVAGLIQASIFS